MSQLFDWIREAMPSDAPGTLSKDDKMPAGKQELPTDRQLLDRIGIFAEKP